MRLISLILACLLLVTGCAKNEEKVNSSLTKEVQSSFSSLDESVLNGGDAYNTFMQAILAKVTCGGVKQEEAGYSVTLTYPSYSAIASLAINDKDGFVKDVKNLYDLGSSSDEISDYVHRYLINCINSVETNTMHSSYAVDKSSLGSSALATIIPFYNELGEQIIAYVTVGTKLPFSITSDTEVPSTFAVNRGLLLSYEKAKLFVTPTVVLSGQEAKDKLKEINEMNSSFSAGNGQVYYVEYKVSNLEKYDVVVDNPFALIDTTSRIKYNYDGFSFVGVSSKKKVPANSEVTMSQVFVGESGKTLGWWSGDGTFLIIE